MSNDPARDEEAVAGVVADYRDFAEQHARTTSPPFAAWARQVLADGDVMARIASLPPIKRQPNLVFAALRWHGATPGDDVDLRAGLLGAGWPDVEATILARSTQTNEVARCAALLPVLARVSGPIALIEIGASAGLVLRLDRYGYRWSDGRTLAAVDPDALVVEGEVDGAALPDPLATPDVVWRAGLDLNPLDPADPDTAAWLRTLVWPGHTARLERLSRALVQAATFPVEIVRGDMRVDLAPLIRRARAEAPEATVVVMHSVALTYLDPKDRPAVVDTIRAGGARWLCLEAPSVLPELIATVDPHLRRENRAVLALDGEVVGFSDGHTGALTLLL